MPGISLHPKSFAFDSSVPIFYPDGVQSPGTLIVLDWSREDCWNKGVPLNLAAATALALVGDPLHPTFAGRTQNIRRLNGALGLGAERAAIRFPTVLTDYMVGKNIAISVFQRFIPTPLASIKPWVPGMAVAVDDVIAVGNLVYSAAAAGNLGADVPTHTAGTAASGTATLGWGLKSTAAGGYGTIGGITGSLVLTSNYPAEYRFFSTSNTAYTHPFAGTLSQWGINHVATSPGGSSINGVSNPAGKQLTAAQVPAIPTNKPLQISAELFNQGSLYSAAGGEVTANTNGLRLENYRIVVENLDVAGRTFAELVEADKKYVARYHPARSLLA